MNKILDPLVSVIIPVYNVASFLSRCLESLMNQTLSQIEILCVDDASEDSSVQIIRACQEKDPRVRLLQQAHQGVSAARNLGIRHARGRYIVFIDGDDWVEADMLEKMWAKAEEDSCDMVVCAAQVHFESQNAIGLRRRRSLQAALTVDSGLWIADGTAGNVWGVVQRPGSWPFVWNKLIRRELIQEHLICFSPKLPLGEDGVFLLLLFQYGSSVVFLPEQLYHYRYQRKASATEKLSLNALTCFGQHIDVVSELLREFSERGLLQKNGSDLLRWILRFLYSDFAALPVQNRTAFSVRVRDALARYDLFTFERELSPVEKRRLRNLLETEKECTQAKRMLEIVWTKVENRLMRIFLRK